MMTKKVTTLITAAALATVCTIHAGGDIYTLKLNGIDTTEYSVADAGQIMTADIKGYETDIDMSQTYNDVSITCPLKDGRITIIVEKGVR